VLAPTAQSVTIPQAVGGAGWTSEIQLVNLDEVANSGFAEFQTGSGSRTFPYTIPPRSSVALRIDDGPSLVEGSVVFGGDRPPSGVAVIAFRRSGVTTVQTGVPAIARGTAFRAYVEGRDGLRSSLSLANDGAVDAVVGLRVSALDGTVPGSLNGSLTVQAHRRVSMFLDQVPGRGALPADFRGVIQLTSSVPLQLMTFGNRTNSRGDLILTSVPPVAEGAAGSFVSLPLLAASGGYETRIVLLGTAASATGGGVLRYANGAGEPVDLGVK
jgi:hypothetical protein